MSFSIIAAVGKNLELGKKGGLCFDLPADLKFFKEKTMGRPIVMGDKTFRSLPGVLPGRKHYIVTMEAKESFPEEVEVIDDLVAFIEKYQDSEEEFFVIGGASIYGQMIEFCDKMYLTEIEAEDTGADVFFPKFDKNKYKRKVLAKRENILEYAHILYVKKEKK